MGKYTHAVTVRMYEGCAVTLGSVARNTTAFELAEQFAERLHGDTSVWGTVIESDDPDLYAPGTAVVVPARSIVAVVVRDIMPGDDDQEVPGIDPDMADIAATQGAAGI